MGSKSPRGDLSQSSNEKIINEIWGYTKEAKEIRAVFEKFNLSIPRLMKCCNKKGESILVAAGAVLGMHDQYDVLVQCECGEIMGFPKDVYGQLTKLFGNGLIKCKRCDPDFLDKLSEALRKLGRTGKFQRINFPIKDEDYMP